MKTIVLLSMFFFHIVDDYYLQGCLAKMKQKDWWFDMLWEKHQYSKLYEKYKYDYLMALFEHGFSWSFMVHIPIVVYLLSQHIDIDSIVLLISVLCNAVIHAVIDNAKANKLTINLVQDQTLHFIQIGLMFIEFMIIFLEVKV